MVVAWTPVESSNISQVGYDAGAQELRVRFNSGSEYVYSDVPGQVFTDFLAADSKGQFLNQNIKGQYEYSKVGG